MCQPRIENYLFIVIYPYFINELLAVGGKAERFLAWESLQHGRALISQ